MFRFSAHVAVLLVQGAIHCFAATPLPVSVNFGTEFFGTDGQWSAAQIRVGTSEQYLWAYPNTISSETWVIAPDGCGTQLACQQARGGVFYSNESSTYDHLGLFDLVNPNRLDLSADYADYGLDNVSISDTVSAPAQVIASISSPQIWLGQLGLSVKDTELTNLTKYNSLISTLVQTESAIPGHSYGYTAGAHYALKNVPGSLVLGGVDTTRFTANDASFTLAPGYVPKVAVIAVAVSSSQSQGLVAMPPNWNSNPLDLMQESQAAYFVVDSSTAFLWMPPEVCDAFASALNLTYNNALNLYMFTNTTNLTSNPRILSDWGLSFTFTLANTTDATTRYQLPISYNAFNLQLSYGFPDLNITDGSSPINYFPLRRANSSNQYTIGRAFLQETYLMVDYERNMFSISPAVFVDTSAVLPNIVPITRPASSTWPGPQSSNSSLSAGAKAGIGVGVAVGVASFFAVAFVLVARRRKTQQSNEKVSSKRRWKLSGRHSKPSEPAAPVSELIGDRCHPRELLVDSSNTRAELPGHNPVEMAADDVPETFLAANQATGDADNSTDIDAITPRADGRANGGRSIRKDYNIRASVTERSESPAPPYSPSEVGQNTSSSGGISSLVSGHQYGSNGSSVAAVSPSVPRAHSQTEMHSPLSPMTPTTHGTSAGFADESEPSTIESSRNALVVVPIRELTRSTSHNSRFRELVDDQHGLSSHPDELPQLRPRFSWEQ